MGRGGGVGGRHGDEHVAGDLGVRYSGVAVGNVFPQAALSG